MCARTLSLTAALGGGRCYLYCRLEGRVLARVSDLARVTQTESDDLGLESFNPKNLSCIVCCLQRGRESRCGNEGGKKNRTEYGKQKERRAGGKPGLGLEAVWVLSRLAHLVPES